MNNADYIVAGVLFGVGLSIAYRAFHGYRVFESTNARMKRLYEKTKHERTVVFLNRLR